MKRNTLILLLLAIGLGTAVYFLEYRDAKPRDEEAPTSKPAWEIKPEEVAGILIRRGGETIELVAEGEKWSLRQPLTAAADDAAVRALLGDLTGVTIEREFPASGDELKSYGLATPPLRVEIKLTSGQSRVIEVGEKDVIGTAAYARIDGGATVAMVGSALLTSAGKTLSEFRDRTLLGGNPADLARVRVFNPAGGFELEQKDGRWKILSPRPGETDETEVTSLISTLTTAEATEIVSETETDAAKYGLTTARTSVRVALANGGERIVTIGSKDGEEYYARVSDKPQIFKVNASFTDRLNTKLNQLKSKVLVSFNRDELATVRIRNANLTLLAERSADGKWLVKEPAEKKDQEASTFHIIDPFETRAIEIVEKPGREVTSALGKPAVEARLTDRAGKVTVVRFSAVVEGHSYVQVEGRPDIFKVPDSVVDNLGFNLDQVIAAAPGQ